MSVVCLPLSAGEDSFELHSVDLELEAVEKQIRDLTGPAQRTRPAQVSFTPAPEVPRSLDAAAAEDASQAPGEDLSPSAATRLRDPRPRTASLPFRETECDTVIIGDSIVRHVRATAAKGKVHTRCLPGARVLDVSAQVPAILKKNIGAVVLHAGNEQHQAEADGDPEEGLQEPGGAGTHHIAHDEDHRVRATSHVPARNREVQ
ncbi:hypothetical protein QTP70_003068 [Hemibagrus guttatus]|uniref:Uncharacterized protein n=1 Tax=Hemibagrus guttatus TaxID=175788 RepID=A0AAE0Q1P0_9TELE|nr:hypothetical protein QTP70_003068 [Hemibagrus guttatus]